MGSQAMTIGEQPLSTHELLSFLHRKGAAQGDQIDAIHRTLPQLLDGAAQAESTERILRHVKVAVLDWCTHKAADAHRNSAGEGLEQLWTSISALCSDHQVR
jgi:hypothetical protein